MKWNSCNRSRMTAAVRMPAFTVLSLTLIACGTSAYAQVAKDAEAYRTLYLTSAGQRDAQDIMTDLRNMLPSAKMIYVPSQNAISVRGTPDDIQLAQRILADIDKTPKTYRLTYTITDIDSGKQTGKQDFTLVVASGATTTLKQGNKVPIVTGILNEGTSTANTQVQYLDVGLMIQASLEGHDDGLRLRSKVEQSRVAEEKSSAAAHDPTVQQTTLEQVSALTPGKPLMLGALDIPGTAQRQQIEVTSELVR